MGLHKWKALGFDIPQPDLLETLEIIVQRLVELGIEEDYITEIVSKRCDTTQRLLAEEY
tara:strand:+ start:560 stop:736 length:177 start_codon:yes stop_codon:yes gene_type:complete